MMPRWSCHGRCGHKWVTAVFMVGRSSEFLGAEAELSQAEQPNPFLGAGAATSVGAQDCGSWLPANPQSLTHIFLRSQVIIVEYLFPSSVCLFACRVLMIFIKRSYVAEMGGDPISYIPQ